jgi:hypothetical protein
MLSAYSRCGGRSTPQSKNGLITTDRGIPPRSRRRCGCRVAEVVAEQRLVPVEVAVDGLRVRVEQQLVGLQRPWAGSCGRGRGSRTAGPARSRQVAVPDEAVHLGHRDPVSAPSASKRHSSTCSATSLNTAKLVPSRRRWPPADRPCPAIPPPRVPSAPSCSPSLRLPRSASPTYPLPRRHAW